jgi:hypothetical protein
LCGWRKSLKRALAVIDTSQRRWSLANGNVWQPGRGRREGHIGEYWIERLTDRHHGTELRRESLAGAGKRCCTLPQARPHRVRDETRRDAATTARHAENSWGAELGLGGHLAMRRIGDMNTQTHRQAAGTDSARRAMPWVRSVSLRVCESVCACITVLAYTHPPVAVFLVWGRARGFDEMGEWLPRWFERAAAPAGSPDQSAQTAQ